MIKKTLGGDRLGSGNRMKAELHNYERSTHDLGNVWRSTMAPGVLYPFYKKICHDGDTWTINLESLIRTMPAIGPCFGSYKLQLDFFEVPIRLYNGILHNNMVKIGMDMARVKLPRMTLRTTDYADTRTRKNPKTYQINPSSLIAYLGLRGIGELENIERAPAKIRRYFNAVPMLAYYDIFKNYYANKQEENAYIINNRITNTQQTELKSFKWQTISINETLGINGTQNLTPNIKITDVNDITSIQQYNWQKITLEFDGDIFWGEGKTYLVLWEGTLGEIKLDIFDNQLTTNLKIEKNTISFELWPENFRKLANLYEISIDELNVRLTGVQYEPCEKEETEIELKKFKLENIDNARYDILRYTNFGTAITIGDGEDIDYPPYNYNTKTNEESEYTESMCRFPMQGLVVKTYQSDIYNAWLSKSWVDGIGGINSISAVAVEEGKIKIDALILSKKVYNMLNRIAISGGTYEDWREAVYGENAVRHAESPIYCGGASGIIAFEEVVSTADTNTETAGDQPLGTLAGKGTLVNAHGGNIEIHITEPAYIMGIASITPLIDYSNGNDFDMTEIESLDDLHKPELDQIGFQDLVLERAAWWTTHWDGEKFTQQAGGKLPSWMDYMTSVNQVYGKFAEEQELDFMVLQRRYEKGYGSWNNASLIGQNPPLTNVSIKDWTTYINPTKFNYQFADPDIDAQNFWAQIGIKATVRRKISAKLIPNL